MKSTAASTPAVIQPGLNAIGLVGLAGAMARASTSRGTMRSPAMAPKPLLTPDNKIKLGPIGFSADPATKRKPPAR